MSQSQNLKKYFKYKEKYLNLQKQMHGGTKYKYKKFYKLLTKKLQALNTNVENKWQLHVTNPEVASRVQSPQKFIDMGKGVEHDIRQEEGSKPSGLWTSGFYGADPNNISWTNFLDDRMREWGNPDTSKFYLVRFDSTNIKQITTEEEMEEFIRDYTLEDGYGGQIIDWEAIQGEGCTGINISPYRFELLRRRFEGASWYRGWDCASQCVWTPRAITEFKKINVRKLKEKCRLNNDESNNENNTGSNTGSNNGSESGSESESNSNASENENENENENASENGNERGNVGRMIRGFNGRLWGRVVDDEGDVYRLESGRIAKKHTRYNKWNFDD